MPLKSAKNLNTETLNDAKNAADYLSSVYEECSSDGQFDAFLIAIRDLIQTNSSMSEVAETAQVGRQALYNMLSENGNPQLHNFASILSAIGLKLKFEPEKEAV